MISPRTMGVPVAAVLALLSLNIAPAFTQTVGSQIVDRELQSKNFANNKIGVSPVRKMVIYLPAGYNASAGSSSGRRYPVIYFLSDPSGGYFHPDPDGSYRALFSVQPTQKLFDQAIAAGIIGPFILVSVDMNTPLGCSWYVNSPVTGNWEDFMIQEVVPYIDANFRTLSDRNARGIAGVFMGGYGAIRFGMRHPDVFGSVYALGPVAPQQGCKSCIRGPIGIFWSTPNRLKT